MKQAFAAIVLVCLSACGGGGTGTPVQPQATPVQVTETFTGSTVQTAATSCSGDSHNITAAEGDMSIRLTATSDPSGALSVQVCGGSDDGNCSIRQQKIAVNQTITGSRRGQAQQTLKFLPHSCVFGGTPMIGTPVTYTATLTYWK